jgi:hypothetical protein
MNNQSRRFTLNSQDKQTIITVIIHGLIGTIVTLISMVFLHLNYGDATPIITTVLSLISLSLTQYLNGPSAATIKIQQLEELVNSLQKNSPQNAPVDPNASSV